MNDSQCTWIIIVTIRIKFRRNFFCYDWNCEILILSKGYIKLLHWCYCKRLLYKRKINKNNINKIFYFYFLTFIKILIFSKNKLGLSLIKDFHLLLYCKIDFFPTKPWEQFSSSSFFNYTIFLKIYTTKICNNNSRWKYFLYSFFFFFLYICR